MYIPRSIPAYLFIFTVLLAGCEPSEQTVDFKADQNPGLSASQSSLPAPATSDIMPEFALDAINGGTFDSSAQEGRVLIFNFWATWCAPCRVEIPDLIELQEEFGGDQFEIVGISIDMDGDTVVKEFVDEMNINYPILIDDGEIANAFGGVFALPTTFVVDKQGKITHRTIGLFPVDSIKEELAAMIAAD